MRAATCPCLGAFAWLVTRPKFDAETFATGAPKTVRLKALKNSPRNMRVALSVSLMLRIKPNDSLYEVDARRSLYERAALPNWKLAGAANAALFSHGFASGSG